MSFPALLEILAILPLWILRHKLRLHSDNPYLFYDSLSFDPKSRSDFAELFEGGFEVFDDFLGENVGIGEIVGFFQALVAEPEDIEAGLVAVDELVVLVRAPAAVRILFGPRRLALVAVLRVVALNELVEVFALQGSRSSSVKCLLVRRS